MLGLFCFVLVFPQKVPFSTSELRRKIAYSSSSQATLVLVGE